MIRIISLRKAVLAGMAGAVAWELALRLLGLVDIVHGLGQLAFPGGAALLWWPAGMALHMLVGVIWAIFYAYFAWSMLPLRPVLQGLVFALVPTVLAGAVVYPQLAVMQADERVLHVSAWALAAQVGWPERVGILLGHLIYGAVLGAIYTHPVGAPTGKTQLSVRARRSRAAPARVVDRAESAFIFATGIECSYPTLEGGRWRCDQMAASGHYRRYAEDFELCVELGVSHLRYGPPLHRICRGPGAYDWAFIDEAMEAMRARGVTPIIDLCHFGLPDWLENFQNPEVPEALAAYAGAFAARYPWVRLYTPVNEMYVCAKLSALDGLWNEQRRDERSFLTAVRHLVRANLGMMQAISAARPDAVFVHSESSEFYQPCCPDPQIVRIADFENERRFLPLDLLRARPVSEGMRGHLREHGMPDAEYDGFMAGTPPRRTVLGVDYYAWNEKLIDTEGDPQAGRARLRGAAGGAGMMSFIRAHGADPGPAQRPYLAGLLTGLVAVVPSAAVFVAFGSFDVAAEDVMRLPRAVAAGVLVAAFAVAGLVYGAVFQRMANDARAGWLLGLAYGFLLWVVAPVVVLPLIGGTAMAAGLAATGFLVTFLAWGLLTGLLFPHVHQPLKGRLQSGDSGLGPNAIAFHLRVQRR